MGKLFGTDGIRGIVGPELNLDIAIKAGAAVARTLKKNNESTLVIGTDTRISCNELKFALISAILSEGVNVIDAGVIPTPAVSFLIKHYNAIGGFVISASHNPAKYNGIKVFNENGMKLPDEVEDTIEGIMLNDFSLNKNENECGKYVNKENESKDVYVNFLLSTLKDKDFSNMHIAIDTANGASFKTAEMLFDELNVHYTLLNNTPDGLNINANAGSTHIEGLSNYVKDNNLDLGIAFDGDADRCLMVDEDGCLVDGDKIMAIYGMYLKDNNKLLNNAIVGTVMSNLGLRKFCEKNGIDFVATKVGDRYVLENMLENDYVIGGEQSGHIILRDFANTGDGELTAIQILSVIKNKGFSLKELASIMETYPQVLKNLNVTREGKEAYKENKVIQDKIKTIEEKLNGEGRVLVRPSGTENLVRVMLEGKDAEEITKYCDEIVEVMDKELNVRMRK